MSCPHRAVLIVTRDVKGTSTSIARQRFNLFCGREPQHEGPHLDPDRNEQWQDHGAELSHILRHEPDED